jgi:hypothetical protein
VVDTHRVTADRFIKQVLQFDSAVKQSQRVDDEQ